MSFGQASQEDLDSGLSSLERAANKLASKRYTDSLHAFTVDAWPILEPSQEFVDNWHVKQLCLLLEDLYNGVLSLDDPDTLEYARRVIINVPPGTMKSLLVSVIFPCWVWAKDPTKRILTAAYSDKRALDANVKARNLIKSAWYQKHFRLQLVEDQDTKGRYDTKAGGWRIATSVGGEGTGLHPDIIIIDDAATATDAASETARKTVNTWYSSTVSTRGVSRNVMVIVIGQRLHEEDLPGYLLAKDRAGWVLVRWPMRFEKCTCPPNLTEFEEDKRCVLHKTDPAWRPDPRDQRTIEGELLFPQLFTEEKVRKLELDLANDAAGQLQQRPSAEGGSLFKREYFKFTDVAPALKRVVRGWDTASTQAGGDYTVGVKLSEEFEWILEPAAGNKPAHNRLKPTGRFFVEDVQRDQLSPDGVDKLIKNTAILDGKACPVREEKEGGASGNAVISARAKLLRGWDYVEVKLGSNKRVRAKPFRAQCEAGNVYLVRGAWNEPYIVELCAFDSGKHDDQVDASSCAFNSVLMEPPPRKVELTW